MTSPVEGTPIKLMTFRQAAQRMNVHPLIFRGLMAGLNVKVDHAGRTIVIPESEYQRIEQHLAKHPEALRRNKTKAKVEAR